MWIPGWVLAVLFVVYVLMPAVEEIQRNREANRRRSDWELWEQYKLECGGGDE